MTLLWLLIIGAVIYIFLKSRGGSKVGARPQARVSKSERNKEFFRFFGIKPQTGISEHEARAAIGAKYAELQAAGDARVEHWDAYERVLDEFDDPDFREGADIKRPSYGQIRAVVDALLAEGKPWSEITDDVDLVAERLTDTYPNLSRDS